MIPAAQAERVRASLQTPLLLGIAGARAQQTDIVRRAPARRLSFERADIAFGKRLNAASAYLYREPAPPLETSGDGVTPQPQPSPAPRPRRLRETA